MSSTPLIIPRQTPVNGSGRPYALATLTVYRAGTTTLATIYSDSARQTPLSNPVTANSAGQFPAIYADPSYNVRLILKNSSGTTLYDEDDVGTTAELTAASVGAALNPLTDAEIAASIGTDDIDTAYPAGNVLRYGENTVPGTTDMTAAIQAAIDQAAQGGAKPYAPPGTYRCTDTVYVTGSCDFSDAIFNFGTNYTAKAVVVSPQKSATPTGQLANAEIRLPGVTHTKSATGWAGVAGSVGVYVVNVWQSRIHIPKSEYFETGVYFYGYNTDVTYNQVTLGRLFNNKVQLKLSWNTAGSGSCNQNHFFGGRFHIESAEGDRVSGTKQIYLLGSSSAAPNSNTFVGCSIEGRSDEYAVHIDGGATYNTFLNCRYEPTIAGKTILCDGANCRWNLFIGGFGLADPSATGVAFTQSNGAYGNCYISGLGTAIEAGTSTSPALAVRNPNSNAYPGLAAYAVGDDMTDKDAYTVALSGSGVGVKNGDGATADQWAVTNNGAMNWGDGTNAADVVLSRIAAGAVGFSTGTIALKDGMTAPSATTGYAKLYVDTSDGDLKVIFADGTIKTIVVDT